MMRPCITKHAYERLSASERSGAFVVHPPFAGFPQPVGPNLNRPDRPRYGWVSIG